MPGKPSTAADRGDATLRVDFDIQTLQAEVHRDRITGVDDPDGFVESAWDKGGFRLSDKMLQPPGRTTCIRWIGLIRRIPDTAAQNRQRDQYGKSFHFLSLPELQ